MSCGWPWNGPNLAPEQIYQLPAADVVSLTDVVPVDQNNGNGTFTTRSVTLQQILNLLSPPFGYVTISQLKQALSTQGKLFTVATAIPSNISNPINIRWNVGSYTILGDAMSVFVQTATGYSENQMTALYTLAATEPA